MRYLPFIAGSYGVTIGLIAVLACGAVVRLRRAERRSALLAPPRHLRANGP